MKITTFSSHFPPPIIAMPVTHLANNPLSHTDPPPPAPLPCSEAGPEAPGPSGGDGQAHSQFLEDGSAGLYSSSAGVGGGGGGRVSASSPGV